MKTFFIILCTNADNLFCTRVLTGKLFFIKRKEKSSPFKWHDIKTFWCPLQQKKRCFKIFYALNFYAKYFKLFLKDMPTEK